MGGPAMIEGGGLGVFAPEEVGPAAVQAANGVHDIVVADEAAVTAVARTLLGYFHGPAAEWEAPDPALLREVVPERRRRAYDVNRAIDGIADTGSPMRSRRLRGS